MIDKALKVLDVLKQHGDAYLVGGAVRDHILGHDCDDVDICSNIEMSKIEELFPTYDLGKNKDFGVVCIKYEGEHFEVAQFRSDGKYSDGRRPDSVQFVKTLKEDVSRRDFTINSLAMNDDFTIIDYFNGQEDLKNKIIRTVGLPERRFDEDYLRMLRAVRFTCRLGFTLDPDTRMAIKMLALNIVNIAKERIHQEVWKMAQQTGSRFADAIVMMKDLGLLQYIYPWIDQMDQYEQPAKWHPEGNVGRHTIAALRTYKGINPLINFSILFHDVGKSYTFKLRDGRPTFYGHDLQGSDMIKDVIGLEMKWDNDLTNTTSFCAKQHMKMHLVPKMRASKIVTLMLDKNWDVCLKVAHADIFSRAKAGHAEKCAEEWKTIEDKLKFLKNKRATPEQALRIRKIINGKMIMEVRDDIDKPAKKIGAIIKATVNHILNNELDWPEDKDEIITFIKGYN